MASSYLGVAAVFISAHGQKMHDCTNVRHGQVAERVLGRAMMTILTQRVSGKVVAANVQNMVSFSYLMVRIVALRSCRLDVMHASAGAAIILRRVATRGARVTSMSAVLFVLAAAPIADTCAINPVQTSDVRALDRRGESFRGQGQHSNAWTRSQVQAG